MAILSHLLLLLYHFVFSFISSVSFAVICDVPRKPWLTGGIIGANRLVWILGNVEPWTKCLYVEFSMFTFTS